MDVARAANANPAGGREGASGEAAALASVRAALDAASTPLALLDGDGRYLHTNAALAALLGFPCCELTGTTAAPGAATAVTALLAAGGEAQATWTLSRSDGGTVQAEITLRPLGGAAVATVKPLAQPTPADILDLVVETSAAGIALVDANGVFLRANAAWAEISGLAVSDLVGTTIWDGLPRDARETARQRIGAIMAGRRNSPVIEETVIVRADGTRRAVLATGQPFDSDGARFLVLTALDITAQRDARLAREATDRELELMFEHTGAALSLLDEDAHYVRVNRAWSELLGWEKSEIEGRGFADLTPGVLDRAVARTMFERNMASGTPVTTTFPMRHRDGSLRWVLNHTSRVELHGKRYLLSTNQDITDMRRTEAALRADEQLLNSLFETTAGGMALVDAGARFVRVNRAGIEMMGWGEDLLGLPFEAIVPERDRPKARTDLLNLLEEGTALPPEITLLRRDGTEIRAVCTSTRVEMGGRRFLLATTIDVTAQRNAEAALRESEARYRLLVETVHEGIWMTDANDVTTFVNDRAAAIMGRRPEEMVGRPYRDLFNDEDWAAGEELRARRRAGNSDQYDFRLHRPDGSECWALVSASPLLDAQGQFGGAIVSMVDITARKRQEEEVARLAMIVDSADDIIADRDPEGRVTSWNKGAERALGYSAEEMLGKSTAALAPDGGEDRAIGAIERVLAGETIAVSPTPRRHKDGHLVWVSGAMFPRRDSTGAIVGVAAITRDVTAEKEARDALVGLAAIVDASTDAIMSFNPDGHITAWNRSAEKVFGWTAAEAIGQTADFLIPAGTQSRWRELFERALEGESFGSAEQRIESHRVTRDGRALLLEISIFPVRDALGTITSVVVSGGDVTERKRHRDEKERLAAIVDSSLDAILLVDRDERIQSWNPAAERDLGYTAEEVIGQPLTMLDIPGRPRRDPGLFRRVFARNMRPGDARFETERRAKDGSVRPFLVTLFPIMEGETVASIGIIAREISDLKAQQAAIARLAAIVESSSDAIVGLNLNAHIVSWNRKAEELLGYTAAEVMGQNALPIAPPEYFPREAAMVAQLRRGEPFGDNETVRLHKNGTPVDINLSGYPVRDESGAIIGYALVARDIREEKRQRNAINRLASIVESSNDLIFTASLDARITSWNRASALVSGYSEAEMMGVPISVFDRDDQGLMPLFERAAAGEAIAGATGRRWRRDGQPLDLMLNVFPLRSADGAITGVAIAARDITDQLRETNARREAEEHLRLVLQSTPMILFACDTAGIIMVVEGLGLEKLGVRPSRVLGRSFFRLCRHFGLHTDADAARLALEGETVTTTVTIGGVALEVRYSPVRDGDGAVTGVAGVAIDTTQRRKAEQARREAEDRARTIAQSVPVILWSCDDQGVITYIEGMGLDALGPPKPRPGISILDLENVDPELAAGVRRALAGEEVSNLITLRGRQFEGTISPLRDETGRIRGAVGLANDVTERRQADQALIQAQKMESLGVLAGGIAHDFNNLLVAVMGNADLALLRLEGDDEARVLLGDIKAASRRAAELARQMLAYSGKGTFVIGHFEVEDLVREISDLLRVSMGHGVSLRYDFGAPGAVMEGDATQLRQVVMNLVLNASEAIGEAGGTVTLATRIVHASRRTFGAMYLSPELPEGDYIEVRVTDTGRGMDQATASRIFDPFFTTKFTGRGLGLAAVLGIVRGHRGAISVTSAEGAGTTFTLLFPKA